MDLQDLMNMLNSGRGPRQTDPLWKKIINNFPEEKGARVSKRFFDAVEEEGLQAEDCIFLLQMMQDIMISEGPSNWIIEIQAARFEFLRRNYGEFIQPVYKKMKLEGKGDVEDFSSFILNPDLMDQIFDWADEYRLESKPFLERKLKENPDLSESDVIKMFVLSQLLTVLEGTLGGMDTTIREKGHVATVGLTMTFITFASFLLDQIMPHSTSASWN